MRVNSNAVNTQVTNVNFSASVRHGRKPVHRQMFAGKSRPRTLIRLALLAGLFIMPAVAGYAETINGGATVTVTAPKTIPGELIVGDAGGGGTLDIASGEVNVLGPGHISDEPGVTGTVNVTGPTSKLTVDGNFIVGNEGVGILTISGGGEVSHDDFYNLAIIGGADTGVGTVTVTGTGSLWDNASMLSVGYSGTGTLNIENGGAVNVSWLSDIGSKSGSTGTVTVTGANSKLTFDDDFAVGQNGTGTLNILAGGEVSNKVGIIGGGTGEGTVTIDGPGSKWTSSSYVDVGAAGTGTLNISGGGKARSEDGFYIGMKDGSKGTVTVDGTNSVLETESSISSSITVGYHGEGKLEIKNGGLATASGGINIGFDEDSIGELEITTGGKAKAKGNIHLGDLSSASASGTATVDGIGSVLESENDIYISASGGGKGKMVVRNGGKVVSGRYFDIGAFNGSSGELEITTGGKVTAEDQFIIGSFSGSSGKATVDGIGSVLEAKNVLLVGDRGAGELKITSNGKVTAAGSVSIGAGSNSTGTVTVDGIGSVLAADGGISVGNSGTGDLTLTGGGKATAAGSVFISRDSNSTGTVSVNDTGSLLESSHVIHVGIEGAGQLEIGNGGKATSVVNIVLGVNPDSSGKVTVDGSGSELATDGSIFVGFQGAGEIALTGGGKAIAGADINIGSDPGSTVTVDGVGSELAAAGSLLVGFGSDGELEITDRGRATAGADINIGMYSGSSGTVTVSDSMLEAGGQLWVGREGNGTLNIRKGGNVIAADTTYIGLFSGSSGSKVTVDGENSLLDIGSELYVGVYDDGELEITDGGKAKAANRVTLGYDPGRSGTATVDGSGSVLATDDGIVVGQGGIGNLTLTGGGKAISVTDIQLGVDPGSSGVLNIGDGGAAGIVSAPAIVGGDGSSSVRFNHNATAAAPYYFTGDGTAAGTAAALTGNLEVVHDGGFTVLTGANDYTGGTTVNAGTLRSGAAGAFAQGAYRVNGGTLDLNSHALTMSSLSGTGGTVALGTANLTVNQAANTTFDGVIQGTGSLTKAGAGTLTLTGTNTYTGLTTVSDGILRSGAAGAFVQNSAYRVDGGTLDLNNYALTMSSLSGTGGTVALGTAKLTVNQAGNTTFAGAIQGTGSLTKTGAGKLTLSGANTYTGLTELLGGVLEISGAGSLSSDALALYGGTTFINNTTGNLGFSRIDVREDKTTWQGNLNMAGKAMNFYLPTTMRAGETMLTATGTVNVSNSVIGVGIDGDTTALKPGDRVNLIDGTAASGVNATGINTRAVGLQGISKIYDFDLAWDKNYLYTTVAKEEDNKQVEAVPDGRMAGLAFANRGADLILGPGMYAAILETERQKVGFVPFAAFSGDALRYDTPSRINVDGYSLIAGMAWRTPNEAQDGLTVTGIFVETGWGNYSSNTVFDSLPTVHSTGDLSYYGGGVLARYEAALGSGGLYGEGSMRGGVTDMAFLTRDILNSSGGETKYDLTSVYFGVHAGVGYAWKITDKTILDLSTKYIVLRLDGDSAVISGDKIRFDATSSQRWRSGGRLAFQAGGYIRPYLGAYYERELTGQVKSLINDKPITAPSMKGDSGLGEIGLTIKPSKTKSLALDFGGQGYLGVRHGVSGTFRFKYEF